MVVKISKNRVDIGSEKLNNAQLMDYTETTVTANSGTAYTIDLTQGNSFNITLTGNCTFSITGAPASGIEGEFKLTLVQGVSGGFTVTWPSSVVWPNNAAPIISSDGRTVMQFKFTTVTGGTYWYGVLTSTVLVGGALWGWGYNNAGQAGTGDTVERSSPVQIGALTNWAAVSNSQSRAGGITFHTLGIKTDGTLWAWGYNNVGQLGNGSSGTNISSPVQIGSLNNWSRIAAGRKHSVAVKTDGTLWAWGYNGHGELGLSDTANRSSPVQVGALTNWSGIGAGEFFSTMLKTDGTLWAMGYNGQGQIGDGSALVSRSSPVLVVGGATNWSSFSVGAFHVLARGSDGSIWAWGYDFQGEIGNNTSGVIKISAPLQVGALTTWAAVAAGIRASYAVKNDGTLWAWGYNGRGGLGLSDAVNRSSPTQVGALTNWARVSGGFYCASALKTDGSMWSWGLNNHGNLGLNDAADRSSPVQVGSGTWSFVDAGARTAFSIQKSAIN